MMLNPNFPSDLDIRPSKPSLPQDDAETYGYLTQKQAIEQYGIAGRVWEAAYILNIYVNPRQDFIFDPPFRQHGLTENFRIIELGSGSGMVGINLARSLEPQRDLLILTDLPEVCPLLRNNLEDALKDDVLGTLVHVRPLAWGNSEHANRIASDPLTDQASKEIVPLTHILCSDLVYFPELLAPLLRTLIQLSSHPFAHPELKVLISYKIRSLPKETPFWAAFGLWFTFEPVLEKSTDDSWQRFGSTLEGPMFVFVARRRAESLTWDVPSDDASLLVGLGARESLQPKADETFESLLFMSIEDDVEP